MEKLSHQGDEHGRRSEDLAKSIKQMISKSVKELIAEIREKRKAIDSGDVTNPTLSEPFQIQDQDAGSSHKEMKQRRRSNPVVGEKVVFFSLPDGFDAEHIDKVKERLGEWKIQRRQRPSKLTDTYYGHTRSSLSFRSVKEVCDFIISESVPKLKQKRKEADESIISESSSCKKLRKNKSNLEAFPEAIEKGEKFATLEEARQKLARVELEGVEDEDDHFRNGVYFSKPDPVDNVLDYDYDDVTVFFI